MLKKHIYVARKNRRFLTAMISGIIYSVVIVLMVRGLDSLTGEPRTTAILMALMCPLYLNLAISAALTNAIVEVVSEKEMKMKVVLELYGLGSVMYWATWAAYYFIVSSMCITSIYLILICFSQVVSKADPLLFLLLLALSYMQQFELAVTLSVFFNKVRTAATVAAYVNMFCIFGGTGMQAWFSDKSSPIWYLANLLPGVNTYNALNSVFWLENLYYCKGQDCRQGLSLESLWMSEFCLVAEAPCPDGMGMVLLPAGRSIAMTLLDCVTYALLAWWLDNVWQGEYGTAKPLMFCLDSAFMCPTRRRRHSSHQSLMCTSQPVALSIRNLRKVFGPKVAVDDMSLEVYGGEIFALLGHNGAGKTTAINCVVGLIPPTHGNTTINGFDIQTEMEGARRQVSICPQDNPFYGFYTVNMHLKLFAGLRGVGAGIVADRVREVLAALGMSEKADDLCSSLSGGQKRRLWVATALIAHSPIAFLDEPTSGMDPSSRRELWDLLLQMRASGRSIIFTTHYLEEADVLADRKAVLARGKVMAAGTSRDLKMQFGIGYHLLVEMKPAASEHDVARLREIVQQHIPTAKVECEPEEERAQAADVARTARFVLPFQEIKLFGTMLLALDASRDALLVSDYSIAMTSLEEVFMALGRLAEAEAGASGTSGNADFQEISPETTDTSRRVHVSHSVGVRAVALLRLEQVRRDRRLLQTLYLAPTFLLVVFTATGKGKIDGAIYPSIALSTSIIPFTTLIIKDRLLKCKYTALTQGCPFSSYWGGTLLAHYFLCMPISLLLAILLAYFKPISLSDDSLPIIFVMVFVYPLSLLIYSYNFSLLFESLEVALKFLPICNLFLGTVPILVVSIFLALPGDYPSYADIIHVVMSFTNPLYGMTGMMVYLAATPDQSTLDTFTSKGALPLYTSLLLILWLGSHLVWKDLRGRTAKPGNFRPFGSERKDEDVLAEEGRVLQSLSPSPEEAVRYMSLNHTYRTRVQGKWLETHAVRGISLGMRSGECFGLLGPNGAGKTTTLSVLTGEVRPPTAGRLFVCGCDMSTKDGIVAACRQMGVCPQVDPLWDAVSGRMHLHFYGRVKGVPEADLAATASTLLRRLGFDAADADKPAGQYSGGMKRKLSLGIALIGYASLLFLDEPSAAVDAAAKRHLWKVIKMRRREQTVVLTTHSMEEAEALCDRIAIQVKGQLRCLGSPLHIKSKYASGYQLELFCKDLSPSFAPSVEAFVASKLTREAKLLECHSGRYLFQLPPMVIGSTLTIGKVFAEVQQGMEDLGITDYSIMQPSLEQVFIRFAREQDEQPDASPAVGAAR